MAIPSQNENVDRVIYQIYKHELEFSLFTLEGPKIGTFFFSGHPKQQILLGTLMTLTFFKFHVPCVRLFSFEISMNSFNFIDSFEVNI